MKRLSVVSILILLCYGAAFAQSPAASPSPKVDSARPQLPKDAPPVAPEFKAKLLPLPSAERVGVNASNQLTLTVGEAIKLALENNNDIDVSRTTAKIAEFSVRAARGGYDPALTSESFFENRSTPTASVIGGARNGLVTLKTLSSTVGIGGLSGFAGGRYNLNFTNSKTNTSNSNATLNPQYPTLLGFSYTQPLFRGRSFDLAKRNLTIAKKNVDLTDAQFRQRASDVVAQVEQAYWDLVYALRNLQVQIEAVKQARLQLESNQRLVEKGVLAPIEAVAASAQVATLEQSVYSAQALATSTENNLKTLMLPDRTNDSWAKAIVPVSPVDIAVPSLPLQEAVSSALANRPEIAQLETTSEINKVNEKYFRDQTRPQVDLTSSYSAQGLAGGLTPASVNPSTGALRVPDQFIGGYNKSLDNLFSNDYPTYRVGLTISLPFGNRTARANLGITLAEGRIIRNNRAQAEQEIEAEVRNTLQNLKSAEARLQAAVASRSLAEQLYESEQRQFRNGTTTMFLVFQRQNELVAAKGRELQAQTDLNKAVSTFHRVTGNTLKANNVDVLK